MIYLFDQFEQVTDEQLQQMIAHLPAGRREKAEKFRYRNGKLSCAIAYMTFLYGYRQETGRADTPDFAIAEDEKPYLADYDDIYFNLSHCNQAAVCMLGRRPVGIDIQEVRSVRDSFLDKICSERERSRITMAPNPEAEFTRIWTEKEAISKYTGEGVFRNVSQISADTAPQNTVIATISLRADLFMTACGDIEDANFTVKTVSIDEILSLL